MQKSVNLNGAELEEDTGIGFRRYRKDLKEDKNEEEATVSCFSWVSRGFRRIRRRLTSRNRRNVWYYNVMTEDPWVYPTYI